MTTSANDPERIRELLLDNLFAVFNVRDPERRMRGQGSCSPRGRGHT